MVSPLLHDSQPEVPHLKPRIGEKVIQPLNPGLSPTASNPAITTPTANVSSAPMNTYDPTSYKGDYRLPMLDLRKPLDDNLIKRVSIKHKSLMILAILGLISTVFTIYSVTQVSHTTQNSQVANTSSVQVGVDIIYVGIVLNLAIYIYFLLAKDPHTVATVLKILLVLEFMSVFGVFWGGSITKALSLLVDGAYLIFTFIVYNIVKTGQ
jgi:hypothetical protein